jgi:hypothetical protein
MQAQNDQNNMLIIIKIMENHDNIIGKIYN